MKYGIYLPNFGPYGDAETLANLARDAEDAGWDGFFIWDHVAGWPLDFVDPWVALTAVAMRTTRIRIGTTVTPLPRCRPWKLVRETVSIDRLSGGRLILGVGIGGGDAEWDHLGGVGVVKGMGSTGMVRLPRPKIRPAMMKKAARAAMPYLYSGVLANVHKPVRRVTKTSNNVMLK